MEEVKKCFLKEGREFSEKIKLSVKRSFCEFNYMVDNYDNNDIVDVVINYVK